jgi:small subunit ribosomal protein S6
MQTYETLFVTTPTLTEEEERSTVETLLQIVTDGGGSLVTNERMGRRRLAYPIEKHTDGVYIRFLYDSDAAVPKELERRIRLSDRILRALTVKLETKRAVAAKEQAVRDIQARAEAAPGEGTDSGSVDSPVETVSPAEEKPPTQPAGEES